MSHPVTVSVRQTDLVLVITVPSGALFYWHGWIRNYIHYKASDENTYPFSDFNGATMGVWESINHFIPHFTGLMTTCPCWFLSWIILVKWATNAWGPNGTRSMADRRLVMNLGYSISTKLIRMWTFKVQSIHLWVGGHQTSLRLPCMIYVICVLCLAWNT